MKKLIIFIMFSLLIHEGAAQDDKKDIKGISEKILAKEFSVKNGSILIKTKKNGQRFFYQKGEGEPKLMGYLEDKVINLKGEIHVFYTRDYSVSIYPDKDSEGEGIYCFEESVDKRSFGGDLEINSIKFRVEGDQITLISRKTKKEK